MSVVRKWILGCFLLLAWVALSVPLGGAVLAAKQALGIEFFSNTGYHAFRACLVDAYGKAEAEAEHRLRPQPSEAP